MTERQEIGGAVLYCGDCIDRLRELHDNSVDSIVTDPPYGLGFMGKKWDALPPSVEVFEQCLRVLKPGGHLLAFGGARTYHRLAVAAEDAGFEIRDQIMWVFGSGFPKSANQGDGWGTALKPAHEPIVMARKPLTGTVAQNVTEHGTGAINVEGCRVEGEIGATYQTLGAGEVGSGGVYEGGYRGEWKNDNPHPDSVRHNAKGRFPANLIHDGSDEVLAAFPDANGQQGALTGNEPSGKMGSANCYGRMDRRHEAVPRIEADKSAARFFYCAKASKADRTNGGTVDNKHPTVKPEALMRYLCRLVTPPGGTVLDPFMGSGSTGKAATKEGFGFIGIDADQESVETARQRIDSTEPEEDERSLDLFA